MNQNRPFKRMKLINYPSICQVKDFIDFKNVFLENNKLFTVEKPEKINIIPPINAPIEKKLIPNSCTTNEFYLASIKNGLCIKNQIIVYGNKHILPDSFRNYELNPPHRSLMYESTSDSFQVIGNLDKITKQPGDSIFLSGENSNGYGHFLLEVVSRLWITQYIDSSQYKIIMNPHDQQRWQLDLLRALGIRPKQIVYLHHPTICERLHIPVQSFVLRKYTSTHAANIWGKIGDYYDDGIGPKKIYVSRSKLTNRRRKLINETEVENLFATHGFTIIHPQELSVRKQISLFRNANIIAGPSGSAMYNCVFQNKPTQKFILTPSDFFKMSDVLINTSTKGQLNYFIGETVDDTRPSNLADWIIDIVKLKKYLKEI